jgi:hypothetical protein
MVIYVDVKDSVDKHIQKANAIDISLVPGEVSA